MSIKFVFRKAWNLGFPARLPWRRSVVSRGSKSPSRWLTRTPANNRVTIFIRLVCNSCGRRSCAFEFHYFQSQCELAGNLYCKKTLKLFYSVGTIIYNIWKVIGNFSFVQTQKTHIQVFPCASGCVLILNSWVRPLPPFHLGPCSHRDVLTGKSNCRSLNINKSTHKRVYWHPSASTSCEHSLKTKPRRLGPTRKHSHVLLVARYKCIMTVGRGKREGKKGTVVSFW